VKETTIKQGHEGNDGGERSSGMEAFIDSIAGLLDGKQADVGILDGEQFQQAVAKGGTLVAEDVLL
jgi:hypothetical protein